MINYGWDFGVVLVNKQAILNGLFVTLEITFFSILFGSILGLILCILKLSKNKKIKIITSIFIEIFRGLPVLVLLIWIFYVMPTIGIRFSPLITSIVGLSLNLGAFSAEIFKIGYNSIHKGQIEAATAIGLNKIQTLKHIVFPQALKIVIPPLTGRYIETIKLTSLASVIAVNELLHQGQNIISISYRPLEIYTVIAFFYLIIIIPLSLGLKKLENQNVRS